MWSKKLDTCHIAWQARFIERRHWPSITILPEGSAVMWSKNYVTPVSLNYQLVYSLRLVHIYIYIYIYIYTKLWFVGMYAYTYVYICDWIYENRPYRHKK